MRTFTLDQLIFFAENCMERLPMLRAMQALGIDEDASFALRAAESTRERNIVRLFWDYGSEYGAQLETYIDSVIAGQPAPGRSRSQYSLGQLAWIHAVGFFPGDMVRDVLTIDIPPGTATQLAASAAQHRTALGIWKDHSQRHGAVLERYLKACLKSYAPGWPHQRAPGETSVDDAERPAL